MTFLANSYLTTGRIEDALALLADALSAKPNAILAIKLAALQTWFDKDDEHAATSRRMLEWAKENMNPDDLERVTRLACQRPIADASTQGAVLLLARKALDLHKEGQPPSPWEHLAIGMAEYRSGHHQEAEATLNAVPAWLAADPQDIGTIEGTANLYRAMSLFQLGREDEARVLYTATEAKMKPLPADEENPFAAEEPDPDDLILWLACKEARELLYPK